MISKSQTIDYRKAFKLLDKWVHTLEYVPIIDLMHVGGESPFKILVSTMLSARTKDEVTTSASKKLFKVVKGPKDLANLSVAELEKLIYPVGF